MGTFRFQCVLVDAAQRFTMFLPNGTPVRSFLSVRLQEYVRIAVDVERGLFFGSPTVSAAANAVRGAVQSAVAGDRIHVSVRGDTLSGIAAAMLGDAARWRDIANANDIDDPLNLPPGTRLVIPPTSGTT
jgi:nucleoid-associated protein YgaU